VEAGLNQIKRNVKFERDFAGTCWETCKDADTGEKFPNCEVSWLRVRTDVNEKGDYTRYHV